VVEVGSDIATRIVVDAYGLLIDRLGSGWCWGAPVVEMGLHGQQASSTAVYSTLKTVLHAAHQTIDTIAEPLTHC